MNNVSKKLIVHAIKYGLILAAVQILIHLMIYILNFNIFNFVFIAVNLIVSIVVLLFFMILASIKFRDNYLEHRIRFIHCWVIGLITGAVALIIMSLYNPFFHYVVPGYLEEQIDNFRNMMANLNVDDNQVEEIVRNIKKGFTPGRLIIQTIIGQGIMSFFMSLLATVFVKKEKNIENIY